MTIFIIQQMPIVRSFVTKHEQSNINLRTSTDSTLYNIFHYHIDVNTYPYRPGYRYNTCKMFIKTCLFTKHRKRFVKKIDERKNYCRGSQFSFYTSIFAETFLITFTKCSTGTQ